MPLFSFSCTCGHKFEAVVSHQEVEESIEKNGKILVPCPECTKTDCDSMGEKVQGIELTADMNKAWARQTWGNK